MTNKRFEIDISKRNRLAAKFDHVPLQSWQLSTRPLNALLRRNPNMSVGDVIRAGESITQIRGIGKKCIEELGLRVSQLVAEADDGIPMEFLTPTPASHSTTDVHTAPPPLSLPESARDLSIDQLHLSLRIHNALIREGITTIGELFDVYGNVSAVRSRSSKIVENALTALLNSLTQDGKVDLLTYWETQRIQLLPSKYEPYASSETIIRELATIIREVLSQYTDERLWLVIQRRYALENTERLTLQDLGDAFGVERERIRQIEEKALTELRAVLIEHRYAGKNYHVHPEILLKVQALCNLVASEAGSTILETDLLDRVCQTFNLKLEDIKPSLFLLFSLAGIDRVEFDNSSLTPVWGYMEAQQRRILKRGVNCIDHLLTKETSLPLSDFDILLHVNKEIDKRRKITLSQIRWCIGLCSSVERREDGLVWGKFECLRGRGNQVERLLIESSHPMSLKAIVRKINYQLVALGNRKVQIRNLRNQLSTDGRFIAVGRSGQWGLKCWLHMDTSSILELMEQCFIVCDRPATVNKIYDYVRDRRPVSRASISMYLLNEDIFARIDRERWGLAIWSEAQDATTWDPQQVADFVAKMFKKARTKELDYKVVKQSLMKAADVSTKQAQGLLNVNPVIKTRKGTKSGELYAVFQPNYGNELAQMGAGFARKEMTLRQRVEETAKRILETAPDTQMPLAKLVSKLRKEHSCPKKTLYQYIANLEYVERIDVPGSRMKICRLKRTREDLSFPQAHNIVDDALRKKVKRSISFLDVTNVDVGLFLLSKEFEATLKKYLRKANTVGKVGNSPKGRWSLDSMISCVKQESIITDQATLHFLRQKRNDRAHGTMPSLKERQVLMNSVQYIASLYIDYIKFFDDLSQNL